ncbi:glycerol kinase GlpK [Altererythrobacter salegens]|uniref:ATP:glycerol 3-phosphotransferase n=1 Tax=Croceibacterium salegens TaxID=1737568 RepID=A0A6I4T2I4_9SPHN|nr:glycerol kinase [Croceibacterium salegens]MXO60872.1 glycerol kinase GlpK [Croceibacterium salegens]
MTEPLFLILDEGTTSTRAMLFNAAGVPRGTAQRELNQHYPRPGWVEHDAGEIWDRTLACAQEMVAAASGPDRIACIGVTNQRETVVAWDRNSGEPLARAIVWQDRRTAGFCGDLRAGGHEAAVRDATGLLLDPYFSATKMRWLLDNDDAVRGAAQRGTLAFGTIDAWLTFKLTGNLLTEAGNASRTLLLPLAGESWDEGLCELFGVPTAALPRVTDSAGDFGTSSLFGAPIPVTGIAGDQQAATIGQGCNSPGETKATFGTGAFVLANMGAEVPRSEHRLLGTVLHQLGGKRHYALEGSVFVAGSLFQWLRDSLNMIVTAAESDELARSVPDSAGVVVIPALSGLGAPHWRADARAAITGLSFAATRAHVVRAALEAISHQTQDLAAAFAADGAAWTSLKIDGGMSANNWLAQDLAGLLQVPVVRPDFVETTALGAAMLAAVGAGLHHSLESAAAAMIVSGERFEPAMDEGVRSTRLANWRAALARL